MEQANSIISIQLRSGAIKEAELIKEHASEQEKARLNFHKLHPETSQDCVYGQMTGNCFNKRSVILLNKCAVPYSDNIRCKKKTSKQKRFPKMFSRDFSHLEIYTAKNGARKRDVVLFIQGKIKKLDI